MERKKVGRKQGSKFINSFYMVRITFDDDEDKRAILEYVESRAKGIGRGRAIRNIIKEQMESNHE